MRPIDSNWETEFAENWDRINSMDPQVLEITDLATGRDLTGFQGLEELTRSFPEISIPGGFGPGSAGYKDQLKYWEEFSRKFQGNTHVQNIMGNNFLTQNFQNIPRKIPSTENSNTPKNMKIFLWQPEGFLYLAEKLENSLKIQPNQNPAITEFLHKIQEFSSEFSQNYLFPHILRWNPRPRPTSDHVTPFARTPGLPRPPIPAALINGQVWHMDYFEGLWEQIQYIYEDPARFVSKIELEVGFSIHKKNF